MFVLYYSYVEIKDPASVCAEQRALCEKLHLYGRIRVSAEGLNGTLNGSQCALVEYMQHTDALFGPIHWKHSSYLSEKDEMSQKFTSLSCQVTKEVVSLDLSAEETEVMKSTPTGVRLTPLEFHQELEKAISSNSSSISSCSSSSSSITSGHDDRDVVLIDVRNIYETRIGAFQVPPECTKIQKIDPCTRKFSDFTRAIDDNIDGLKEKKILMYCTGGVRCERASSYLRAKGLDSVFQLHGGIHNYLENFPNGGYFKGKNFVYDPRRAIPSEQGTENVIGKCFRCAKLYDDYSSEIRCSQCRMLVLICDECEKSRCEKVQAFIRSVQCERCVNSSGKDLRMMSFTAEEFKIQGQQEFFPVEFNAYDILEVSRNARKEEIKSSHKKMISKYHPAKAKLEEKEACERRLIIMNRAFSFVGENPSRRDLYDNYWFNDNNDSSQ